ncbi:MAG: S1 RNA-binding domain-containing protein [Coleofasciculus sp. S288]|nr:S1 RNA-binding domain-containing protein [Coleofasciculus sp. S288]
MNSFSSSFIPGETVVGTVLSLEPTGALINIGTQTPAYLPLQAISMACVGTPEEVLKLNETREFWILASSEEQGQSRFVLSLRKLEEKLTWERLRQMKAENATVYAKVVATSTDEVLVDIEGLRGSIYHNELVTNKPIEELIGEILPLKIRYADEDGKSLNLSHNQALVARYIKQLKVGEVVVGTVRHIKHFGVFVDIGGLVGLLRITAISHEHFDSPHSIFKVNEQLKVMIIDLDFERNIISLSTKALEPVPGDMLRNPEYYQTG